MRNLAILIFAADLAIAALFLAFIGMGGSPDMFDLDGEKNFGAWWGQGKLLMAAAAIAVVPLFAFDRRLTGVSLYWTLAIGLTFLSADEELGLHERITSLNNSHGGYLPMFNGNHGAWIGVYAVIFVILLVALTRPILTFIKSDPKSTALIAIGLAVFVTGAVIVEVMGYNGLLGGMGSPLQVGVEEMLEQFGVSLLLLGCVQHTRKVILNPLPKTV